MEISKNKICCRVCRANHLKNKVFLQCCNQARFQVMDHGIVLKYDAFAPLSILAGEHEMNSAVADSRTKNRFTSSPSVFQFRILTFISQSALGSIITAATDR